MCVQKVAGASPDRWRQCVKGDSPWSMGQCLVFLCHPPITRRPSTMSPWQTSCPASAAEPLLDCGACRLQASGDSTGGRAWSRMTTTTVRARRVGRPSGSAEWCTVSVSSVQDTICQDTFHKTQSVQDTICSRHISQDTICSRHISRCFTSPSCLSMRCRSLRMSTRKASQDTICSRHDRFMTQSVQDTFHGFSFCHTPMSTSPAPVIEYVASVSAITYTALSPVTEYVAPAPVVTYAAASWDIDYVSHSN